ncbi:MAG TPA: L,D-transpeptidase family protein [Ruminiclostridium sp.]
MVRKYLCVGTLVITLLLQSITVCSAASTISIGAQPSISIESSTEFDADAQVSEQQMSQDEFNKQKDQLLIDQGQLKNAQEQLQKDQEQLRKDQDILVKAQEQLKKELEKLDTQNKLKKLNSEVNSSTYLSYLKSLGYYQNIYKNDEKLNIRNTLLLFQSNHNMSVTGTWDDATKTMLINRLLSKSFTYLDVVKKAPTKGRWIAINKTKRTLTLYEDTKVLKKYPVAVGNPSSLTKSGKFIINMKLIDPDWGGGGIGKPVKGGIPQNPLGSRWIGINRTDGSYGMHGTNSLYSIGTYASHGCIRMQNYCVEELFPLIPMKSNVWVGTGDELKNWGITQNAFETQSSTK